MIDISIFWLVTALYSCTALICTIVGTILTEVEDEHEEDILKHAFYIQRWMHRVLSDEMNMVGISICLAVVTIFIFPGNLLLLVIHAIMKIALLFWEVFKKIFRKKERKS